MANTKLWLTDLGSVEITPEIEAEMVELTKEEAAEHLNDIAWKRFGPRGMVRPGREAIGTRRLDG